MVTLNTLSEQLADTPDLRQFLDIWLDWRGEKLLPLRRDVRPEALGSTMGSMAILEIEAEDRILFRLHATNITNLTGFEPKEVNIIDMLDPVERQARITRYRNLRQIPCGMFTKQELVLADSRTFDIAILFLPVTQSADELPAFAYASHAILTAVSWDHNPAKPHFPLAKEFAYVDIGNGAPDH
ncbi:MAG: PAS domain-containing protein [Alphaproteobacteria bacterium]|jgi:hypothetical protein|nr:PAS domain-containing protein [Alphaproteobacteria bacterium]